MIIRLTNYKTFNAVTAVHAGPDAATDMGQFPAARWNPTDRVYLIRVEQVPTLIDHFEAAGAVVLDERGLADGTRCPACNAAPGNPCLNRADGQPLGHAHVERRP